MKPRCDVGVDLAGGHLRDGAARNRPGAALVFADREERHVAEQIVGRADHAIRGPIRSRPRSDEERRGVGRIELRDLELDLRAHRHRQRRRAREKRASGRSCAAAFSTLPPTSATSASSRLITTSSGLADSNWKPRSRFRSSPARFERPQRRAVFERVLAAREQVAFLLEVGRLGFLRDPCRAARAGARPRRGRRGSARLPSPARRAPGRSTRRRAAPPGRVNARTTCTSASAFLYATTSTSALAPAAGGREIGELDRRRHVLLAG